MSGFLLVLVLGSRLVQPEAAAPVCPDLTVDANIQGGWGLNNTATDVSSKANDLTVSGGQGFQNTTVAEGSHASLESNASGKFFNRTDANLSADFPAKNGTTTTAAAWGGWFRPVNLGGTDIQMGKGGPMMLRSTSGSWECRMAGTLATADAQFTINQFDHVVCNWTGSTLTLYVDGVAQLDVESVASMNTNTADFGLVGDTFGQSDSIGDEGFVFDRSLTQTEIDCIRTNTLDGTP